MTGAPPGHPSSAPSSSCRKYAGVRPKAEGRSPSCGTTTNRVRIAAPPAAVFAALVSPDLAARWLAPPPMRCEMHRYDARAEGEIHYVLKMAPGGEAEAKTDAGDVCRGRFLAVEPPRHLVQAFAFEGDDPGLRGEMRVEIMLSPDGSGTSLVATCTDIPPAIPPDANAEGWDLSLAQLRRLVEAQR